MAEQFISADQWDKIRWIMRSCGLQAQRSANEQFQVFEKGFEDYVTNVDRQLDAQLASEFAALFPNDGVITEENPQSRQLFQQDYQRLWCIDPVDGTDDFIQGRAHYSVMVGLLQGDRPRAGWIYAPEFDQLYYGGENVGLFQAEGDRPPEPLIPNQPAPPSADFCPMIIGDKDRKRYGDAIAQRIPGASFYSIGSFGLKVMEVINGRAGLYAYFNGRVKLWDTVGPLALALAAGLECCDLEGNPLSFTADALDLESLAHRQTVIIGWSPYVAALRSHLQSAVEAIDQA